MSNFNFGGGAGPGQTPPPPIELPPQQVAQGVATVPPPQQPEQQPKRSGAGGGITPAGLISLLAIVILMLGLAALGNRLWPINSGIDSAWRGTDGNARELTSFLRSEGFTCSDEATATELHVHRLCAKFEENSKVAIEFAGPTSGEIMRVYVQPHGPLTSAGASAASRAIELSIPDQNVQRTAATIVAGGPNSTQEVKGSWGKAGWVEDTFTVARTWTGPITGAYIPGDLPGIRAAASTNGYRCDDRPEVLQCQRVANGASWTFTAHQSADPGKLSAIVFTGAINDPTQLDPAEELDAVLPGSAELDRMKWFVSTADQGTGQAGFVRGIRMTYAVTPAQVVIDAGNGCRLDEGVVTC